MFEINHAIVSVNGPISICADVVGKGMVIIQRTDLTSLFDKKLLAYDNWHVTYNAGKPIPGYRDGFGVIEFDPLVPNDQGFKPTDSMTHKQMMQYLSHESSHDKRVINAAALVEDIIKFVKQNK